MKKENTFVLKLCIATFFFCGLQVYGQKEYHFDYLLEYSFYKPSISDTITVYFLTNSKNNAYRATFRKNEKDSVHWKFEFSDENGVFSKFKLKKTGYKNAATITLSCDLVRPYRNPYRYQTKNYDFIILKDTLINGTTFSHYVIKCTRSDRYIKRKKLGVTHFIVDNSTNYHMPFFTHSTEYEEWKTFKNLPYGFPQEKYYINLDGSLEYKYVLTNVKKVKKTIVVPKECDYTKENKYTIDIEIKN